MVIQNDKGRPESRPTFAGIEGTDSAGPAPRYAGVPQFEQNFDPGGIGVWQFLQACGTIDWPQLLQNFDPAITCP